MKKNIYYIVNFFYGVNYGANLTAYALYEIISNFTKNVYILDNIQFRENLLYKKYYVKNFIEKHCKIKKYNKNKNAVLITGSDQVFNPNCLPKYFNDNILNFGLPENTKIAMSASFGVDEELFVKQNSLETIKDMEISLKSFDSISVREKTGVEICTKLFGLNAEWIIDPVFILDKEKWEKLAEEGKINSHGKIVSYIFKKTKEQDSAIKYLTKKYKTTNIELGDYKKNPEEWLLAIKNCELFVTNSYHGVCFAIIFNKPFICFTNFLNKTTRFDSLFEMLNIENCSSKACEIYQKDCIFKIDYNEVNKTIEKERQRGIDYLKRAIDAPTFINENKINARLNYLEKRVAELEKQNTLKVQLLKKIWQIWLTLFYNMPNFIQRIIQFLRSSNANIR